MVDIFTLLLPPVPGSVSAGTSGPGPGGGNGPGPGPGGGGGTSAGPPSDMSSIFPEMQQSFSKEVKPVQITDLGACAVGRLIDVTEH